MALHDRGFCRFRIGTTRGDRRGEGTQWDNGPPRQRLAGRSLPSPRASNDLRSNGWPRSQARALERRGDQSTTTGDPGSPVYLVEEGLVALEMVVPGREPVTIQTVGPGEIFGWSSLFYQRPKTSAARALTPTRAQALDSARLRTRLRR